MKGPLLLLLGALMVAAVPCYLIYEVWQQAGSTMP